MDQHVQRIIDLAFIETKGGAKVYHILPLFGNDTSRHLNIDFTQFFCQIGQFLNFRNEIYKT